MKSILLLILYPLVLAGCSGLSDCVCPTHYAPVCGANGKTYANSCEAECEGVDYIDGECPVYGLGVVEYSGDSLCGFYIRILGALYKPRNLPVEYAASNTAVGIRFRRMNTWYTCDEPYGVYQEIDLLEISKLSK